MRAMTAAVLEAVDQPLVVDEVGLRDPKAGEVLVRVAHCGVCHSDLSVIDGSFPSPLPVVLGHEATGVVEEVGPGVTAVVPGDPVVLTPLPSCGQCYFCARGQPTLCANHSSSLFTSTMPDGTSPIERGGDVVYRGLATAAFAEFAVMPEIGVVRIPPDVDLGIACVLGCAVQTGVGAVLNTAKVEEGATVVVLGAGGIGISVTQGAALAGASTIVLVEPDPERRGAALRFGATHVLDPFTDDVATAGLDLTGVGFDYAFETAGKAALIERSISAVRPGGTVVCVGAPPLAEGITIPSVVTFTATEKRLIGCLLGSVSSQYDVPRLVALWQAGRLDLDAMVTARFPLTKVNDAVDGARSLQGLRTVIDVA
jgi:S-(hydroxymethyl)glutathione dehydrogenase / alcohol dehydrogenase